MTSTLSDFGTFKSTLADWANRGDWSDALLTSFVRSAEEKLNQELRIDRMVDTDDALVFNCCAPLPDDWLEMDLVRLVPSTTSTVQSLSGFIPLEYKPREEFFRTPQASSGYYDTPYSTFGYYTIVGRRIFIGGPPDDVNGNVVRIDYFQEVPVFADSTPSWVYTKYPSLYRCAALMHADLHAVGEENQAAAQKQLAEDMIQKLNSNFRWSRASGSRLHRTKLRSFG
jgi:hypothetical protein